jgi:hypothetical protein
MANDSLEQLKNLKELIPSRSLAVVLRARHPDIYQWVIDNTDSSSKTFNERVSWLLNPEPLVCENNKRKKFLPSKNRFGFCGGPGKCECHRKSVIDRVKKTSVFGTESFLQDRRDGWLERLGVDNPQKLPEQREAAKQRMSGKKHTSERLETYLRDGYKSVTERVQDYVVPLFGEEEYIGSFRKNIYQWQCIKCSRKISSHVDYGTVPRCQTCFPKTVSAGELDIRKFLDSVGVSYEINNREIIYPHELDIVVPGRKIAIEYNGIYWHSDKKRNPDYHLNKFLRCQEQGIHLIQIFEDQWQSRPEIICSRLKSVMGFDSREWARNCKVQNLSASEAANFLNQHHIQGSVGSEINLCLKLQDQTVAVMTFGPSRFDKNCEYELLRYCSKGTVVGGAGKLFKYFIRNWFE